jgi:hypothetical protein
VIFSGDADIIAKKLEKFKAASSLKLGNLSPGLEAIIHFLVV